MMKPGIKFECGEIVLVQFPFTDMVDVVQILS